MSDEYEETFSKCRSYHKGLSAMAIDGEVVVLFDGKLPPALARKQSEEWRRQHTETFSFRFTRDRFNFASSHQAVRTVRNESGEEEIQLELQAANYEVSRVWASRLHRNKVRW